MFIYNFLLLLLIIFISKSIQKYCKNVVNLEGKWNYTQNIEIPLLQRDCPIFDKKYNFTDSPALKYSSCSYKEAYFISNHNCDILNITQSIHLLLLQKNNQYNKLHVTIIGDSLSLQHYYSLLCNIERLKLENLIEIKLISSTTLRNDLNCDTKCYTDKYWHTNDHLKQFCVGCLNPNSTKHENMNYSFIKNWNEEYEKNILLTKSMNEIKIKYIIIIGTGAWYNEPLMIGHNSTEEYSLMLLKTGKILHNYYKLYNITSIWLPLPPIIELKQQYLWNKFQLRNIEAIKILKNYNIITFSNELLRQRKIDDNKISTDGMHYCNLGYTSVPTFNLELIFHNIVNNYHQKIKALKYHNNHHL